MNKFFEILFGLIFLVFSVYFLTTNTAGFGTSALIFLKGALVWVVLFIGLIFVFLGINDLGN